MDESSASPPIKLFRREQSIVHALRAGWTTCPPDTQGYEKLAGLWNDFADWFVPGYGRFVPAAGVYYRQPVRCVLDLACGTGLLTRQLAARVDCVVGLDASGAMLREARLRTTETNVRYVEMDFRNFELAESFDAVVCGSDSLNYLETAQQLADVFRCVERHLCAGGLFIFDVLDNGCSRHCANPCIAYR